MSEVQSQSAEEARRQRIFETRDGLQAVKDGSLEDWTIVGDELDTLVTPHHVDSYIAAHRTKFGYEFRDLYPRIKNN